jgi:hypothetical protein
LDTPLCIKGLIYSQSARFLISKYKIICFVYVDTKRDDTSVGFLEEREWYLQMGRPLPLHPVLNLRLLDGLQSVL